MYKDPPVTDEQRQVWKTEVDRLGRGNRCGLEAAEES